MAVALAVLCLTGCASKRVDPQWVYFPPPPAAPHVVHLASFNSLGELVPPRVTMRDLLRGTPPSPYVQKPAGIDYQDGHLYICDTGLNVVHDWNLATGASRRIGQRGDGALQKPVDVAVNKDGMIFVADTKRQEVVAFGADGSLHGKLRPSSDEAFHPTSVVLLSEKTHALLAATDATTHDLIAFMLDASWPFEKGEHAAMFSELPEGSSKIGRAHV